jgi:hypothetical protein
VAAQLVASRVALSSIGLSIMSLLNLFEIGNSYASSGRSLLNTSLEEER